MSSPAAAAANPLLQPSPLDHGFPQFDRIQDDHFEPAFEAAMKEHLAEVDAIIANPEPPTFDNTLVALERAGSTFNRVYAIFGNLALCNTNDTLKAIEQRMATKLAAHRDDIALNLALFTRIRALYDNKSLPDVAAQMPTEEHKRLLWRYYIDFERSGACLNESDKTRLRQLNGEIASLETSFGQALLNETNRSAVWFNDEAELAGLTPEQIASAKRAAEAVPEGERNGKLLVKLINTTQQPPLDSLTDRTSRQKILAASMARGSSGGPYDTTQKIVDLTGKRLERAKLLGYPHHAAFQLADQIIGGVDRVNELLQSLVPAAVANARAEAQVMQPLADADADAAKRPRDSIRAYDWDFYAEQVRRRDYEFDDSALKPYFELNRVMKDGVFWAATQLYGLQFVERHDLPVYHKTVKVYNVYEEDGKTLVAIFLTDFYARDNKKGGAWMSDYLSQSRLLGQIPIVANHLNVPEPASPEQPSLLTFDEVRTLFHEFGHGLHSILSNVHFPRFSGTNVPTDFVEFPSQVNEMWALHPTVLAHYAVHYQTNEPMPSDLITKAQSVEKFNQGYRTTEYLAAAILDQQFHQLDAPLANASDVVAFEAKVLQSFGLNYDAVPPRYRATYFAHNFSTDSYASKYYAYLWSEVLDADAAEWFRRHGGATRANGEKMRQLVLSRGGSADPLGLFVALLGREPSLEPLLQRRGLTIGAAKPVSA